MKMCIRDSFQTLHYILSGAAENYVEHENVHRKIISFHGSGTVFPGYHQHDYKIERSIVTKAICSCLLYTSRCV